MSFRSIASVCVHEAAHTLVAAKLCGARVLSVRADADCGETIIQAITDNLMLRVLCAGALGERVLGFEPVHYAADSDKSLAVRLLALPTHSDPWYDSRGALAWREVEMFLQSHRGLLTYLADTLWARGRMHGWEVEQTLQRYRA